MSSATGDSIRKPAEADVASNNVYNNQSESQKPGDNGEKNKTNKSSSESQGNCYWWVKATFVLLFSFKFRISSDCNNPSLWF